MNFNQIFSTFSSQFLIFCFIFLLCSPLKAQVGFTQTGNASFYAAKFNGRKTFSGEIFNSNALTAAHRELAFNSMVRVTNLANNKSIIVRINDRGPFKKERILDVSRAGAERLDMIRHGTAYIKIEVIGVEGKIDKQAADNTQVAKTEKNNDTKNDNSTFLTGKTYSVWGTEKFPKGYCVQLFAFEELDNAKEKCKELINKNLEEAFIQVGWEHNARIYRVMYGSFDQRHEAKNFKEVLKRRGYKGFIKKHFN